MTFDLRDAKVMLVTWLSAPNRPYSSNRRYIIVAKMELLRPEWAACLGRRALGIK